MHNDVLLVAIDAGRSRTNVYYRIGENECYDEFPSCVGSARSLNNGRKLEAIDSIITIDGQQLFVGGIAKEEAIDAAQIMTQTKVHFDTKVLILTALARINQSFDKVFIMTACPLGIHKPNEKNGIKNLLIGKHAVAINGVEKEFEVVRCEVSAEAGSASWVLQMQEKIYHVIDVGSTTYNVATFKGKNWIDKLSFTGFEGIETVRLYTSHGMARIVASEFYRVIRQQMGVVVLIGGKANELKSAFEQYFRDVRVPENPHTITVRAIYEIGAFLQKVKTPS